VTDANDCSATLTQEITQPAPVTFTATPVGNTCVGASNGKIQLSKSHLTYQLNGVGNFQSVTEFTGLSAGSYTIIADSAGCKSESVTVSVPEPLPIEEDSRTVTPVSCNGLSDGTISIAAKGGSGNYLYDIDFSGATQPSSGYFTGLPAGSYTITITDANDPDCSIDVIAEVSQPDSLQISATASKLSCSSIMADPDGTITVTVSGGTAPYVYDNGITPSAAINETTYIFEELNTGNYTVTVTDANGCSTDTVTTVEAPEDITISIEQTPDPVLCYGDKATLTVHATGESGRTLEYNNNSAGWVSDNIFPNLGGGTYEIKVRYAGSQYENCPPASETHQIIVPEQVSFTLNASSVTCFGEEDGTVTVSVSGGSGTYTYSISGPETNISDQAGTNPRTFNGLKAGMYTVSVKDDKNCAAPASQTIEVEEPDELVLSESHTDVSCPDPVNNPPDGTITITVTGGTAPYTYSDGTNTSGPISNNSYTFTGLEAGGPYVVTVTDANGCNETISATITRPAEITFTAVPDNNNLACEGVTTFITVTITSPAQGNFQYRLVGGQWQNYSWSGNNRIESVGPGNHTVEVAYQSATTCSNASQSVLINPISVEFELEGVRNICAGATDASITILNPSPVTGVEYKLDGPESRPFQSGLVFDNLPGGNYIVTAKVIADGCEVTKGIDISDPEAIIIDDDAVQHVMCYGESNGSIVISASGGTAPLTYSIAPNVGVNHNDGSFTDLPEGTYQISVTDANNCTPVTKEITVTQPNELRAEVKPEDIIHAGCFGTATGSATVTVTGGTEPYSYQWSTGETEAEVENLTAGTYTVDITDANGCQTQASVTINQPAEFLAELRDKRDISCFNENDGYIKIEITGGTAPYEYDINGTPQGQILGTIIEQNNLREGTYTVTITDDNGCDVLVENILIRKPSEISGIFIVEEISCHGESDGKLTINASGGNIAGEQIPVYSYEWSTGATTSSIENLGPGEYWVDITVGTNCTERFTYTLNDPDKLEIAIISRQDVSCFGETDGSVEIEVAGGSGNYTYDWRDSLDGQISTSETAANLPAGTYTIKVSDALHPACSIDSAIVITQPALIADITLHPEDDNLECAGFTTNLKVRAKAEKGRVLEFSIDNSNWQTDSVFVVGPGTYDAWVRYAVGNGCVQQSSAPVTITSRPEIIIKSVTADPSFLDCAIPGQKATITVEIEGNPGPLQYNINGGTWQTSNIFGNMNAGVHTVGVKYASGASCEVYDAVTILSGSTIVIDEITAVPQSLDCYGDQSLITVTATGDGHANMEYSFDGGSTWQAGNSCEVNGSGIYQVIVRYENDNNCPAYGMIEVTSPAELKIINVDYQSRMDCYGETTAVTVEASVVAGVEFSLYDGIWQGTNVFSDVPAGDYTARVRYKANGTCEATYPVKISQPEELRIVRSKADKPELDCTGDLTAIRIYATGDALRPIEFSIDGGTTWQADSIFTDIASGNYHVKVRYAFPYPACEVDGDSIIITESSPIVITNVTSGATSVSCGDVTTITIDASGDSARELEYSINTGTDWFANDGQFTNVGIGVYEILVRYAAPYEMCVVAGDTVTISNNDPLSVSITADVTELDCSGGVATVTATVSNAEAGKDIVYRLNGSTWQSNNVFPNLGGGTYIVEAAYEGGENCPEISNQIVIKKNDPISITDVTINGIAVDRLYLDCFNSTATVRVTATGTGAMEYILESGSQTLGPQPVNEFTNVLPGTYTIKVRYAGARYPCEEIFGQQVIITRPETLKITDVVVGRNSLDCAGDLTTLRIIADSDDVNLRIEYSIDSIHWQNNGNFTVGANPGMKVYARYEGTSCVVTGTSPEVKAPAAIDITNVSVDKTVVECNGIDFAVITVTALGESGKNLEFSADGLRWKDYNAGSGDTLHVTSGQYIIRVRYKGGTGTCEVQDTKVIKIDGTSDILFTSVIPGTNKVNCHGEKTTLVVTVSFDTQKTLQMSIDGVNWVDAPTGTYTFTDIAAGVPVYVSARYSDDETCITSSDAIIIQQPDLIVISLVGDPQNASGCISEIPGSAMIYVSGGSGNYRYQVDGAGNWVEFTGNTVTVPDLIEGAHTINVRDDNMCIADQALSVVITNPDVMQVTANVMNVRCYGERNGSITVRVAYGHAPYTITVNGADYTGVAAGQEIVVNGLSGGTYPVKVVDSRNCERTIYPVVKEPVLLELSFSCITHICPGGMYGSLERNIKGGWDPVVVEWYKDGVPMSPSPSPDYLEEGVYRLVARDYAQCTDTAEIELYKLTDIIYDSVKIHGVVCQNLNSGSVVVVNPQGGAGGPYVYRVRNAFSGSVVPGFDWAKWENDSIFGLSQGNYIVDIRDERAGDACPGNAVCPAEEIPVTVGTETGISIDKISVEDPVCYGSDDGKITGIIVTGSTFPLEYKLKYPNGTETEWQSDNTFENISAGNYTVYVREEPNTGNGCEASKDTLIAGPQPFDFENINQGNPGCGMPTEYVEFDVKGGTGELKVSFNGIDISDKTLNDPAINSWHFKYELVKGGKAILRVEDKNGCKDSTTLDIPYTTDLEIDDVQITPNKCPDDRNAEISVLAKDRLGTPHVSFSYKLYRGTVTDERYLVQTIEKTVLTEYAVFTGLANGEYTVSVSDDRSPVPCYTEDYLLTVTNTDNVSIEDVMSIDNSCPGKKEGRFLFAIVGDPLLYTQYSYSLNGGMPVIVSADAQGRSDVEITGLGKGDYTLDIFYGDCSVRELFTINESSVVHPDIAAVPATGCPGDATGKIDITMTEPSGIPYTYWYSALADETYVNFSPRNGFTTSISSLAAGEYKVVVRENGGCLSDTITVEVPDVPAMEIKYTDINGASCTGISNGKIGITIVNGTAPYIISVKEKPDYASEPVPSTEAGYDAVFENVTGGTYVFTVTDVNNCTADISVDIEAPRLVQINVTHTDVACDGSGNTVNGQIHVEVTEPVPGNCEYVINDVSSGFTSDTEKTFSNLIAGTYRVVVREQSGCLSDTLIIIKGVDAPVVTFNPLESAVSCFGVDDGTFDFTVEDTGDYQYQLTTDGIADPAKWLNGSTGSFSGLASGNYLLMVSNKITGCSWNYPIAIKAPQAMNIAIDVLSVFREDCSEDVTLTVKASGGTSPYVYFMDGFQQGNDSVFLYVNEGDHVFSVTDDKGCTGDYTHHVSISEPIDVTATIRDINCNMDGNGHIILQQSGSELYSYLWDDGSTDSWRYDLNAGQYSVAITNTQGTCTIDTIFEVRADHYIDVSIAIQENPDNRYFCPDEQLILTGSVEINGEPVLPGSSVYANWILPDGSTSNFVDNNPITINAVTGIVELTASSENCSSSDTVRLRLKPVPSISFSVDSIYIPDDEIFVLDVEASDFVNYEWTSVPDGHASGLPAPPTQISLSTPNGHYLLILTLTGENECNNSDTVFVSRSLDLFIPNAFTPNNDGIHDLWIIYNLEQYVNFGYSAEVAVFTRSGVPVFSYKGIGYNDPNNAFDGRYNGNDLPIGTYYYVVKIGPHTFTGALTIVR
jgi:gliding motility-associated-like protein